MEAIGNVIYPEKFNSQRIKRHIKFDEELKEILERSGFKQDFVRLFRSRLKHLEQYWEKCVDKTDWFESLKQAPGLYSMKFKNVPKNIRIIFTFTDYKKRNISLLVCTFEEKKKKDYSKAIKIANERIEQIKPLLD